MTDSTTPPPSTAPLTMTPAAVRRVHELIMGEQNPALMLRVYIMGGGCSGFQYHFTFTDALKQGDQIMRFPVVDHDTGIFRVSHLYQGIDNDTTFFDHQVFNTSIDSTEKSMHLDTPKSLDEAAITALSQARLGADERSMSLCVDKLSVQYLQGATIDFRHDVQGQRFVVQNPNAKTTCGCGASFDTQ